MLAGDLDAVQRASPANALKHCSAQLRLAGEPELASRFAAAAATITSLELKQIAEEQRTGPAADRVSRPPAP